MALGLLCHRPMHWLHPSVCVWGVDVEVVLIGCGSAVGAWLTLGLRPYFSILSTEEQEQEHPWFITND